MFGVHVLRITVVSICAGVECVTFVFLTRRDPWTNGLTLLWLRLSRTVMKGWAGGGGGYGVYVDGWCVYVDSR